MERFIAKRFRSFGGGLSLDTAALARYTDLIDLSIGDTDIVTDERIIDAAFRDAKAGYTHYGDPHGDPELIDTCCRAWEEDFAQHIEPERVLVTTSSCLGMSLVMLAILDPGDEVLVFSPYFSMYKEQIELAGGVCVEVPTYADEGFEIEKERLEAAISERTKAMIFNNPTNPTAMAYGKDTMQLLADTAAAHDLLIVADEIYTSYMFSEPFTPMRTLPGAAGRTVTLNSFSKNYLMTGWRVGAVIAEPELISTMQRINGALIYTAPSISQRAAIQALNDRKSIRERYIKEYRERVLYAAERIRSIPYFEICEPRGTFYLFPSISRTGLGSAQFCAELLNKAHILAADGAAFGETGEGHIRIACTVGTDKLCEAFNRMEKLKF